MKKLIVAPTKGQAEAERVRRGIPRSDAHLASTADSLRGHSVAPNDLIIVDETNLRDGVSEGLALVVQPLGRGMSRPVNGPKFAKGGIVLPRPQDRQDARPRDWYRITPLNKAADGEDDTEDQAVTEVYIYGVIGDSFWDDSSVPASTFVKEFDAIDADEISIRINSPGGDVYDGITILNAIRRHSAAVTVTVDGIAASAASFIAMGGDEIVMARNSELMIHDASMIAWGNAGDLRTAAERLDKVSDNIASIYAGKAGGKPTAWRDAMLAETWYSADEAVEAGLADRVDAEDEAPGDVENYFDLSVFNFAGRAKAPAPKFPVRNGPVSTPHRPAEPDSTTHQEEGTDMASDTLISGLRKRLGFAEDVNDDQDILDAVDEALEERAETTTSTTTAVPEGSVLVDEATYQTLQSDAAAGREARNQQIADHRTQVVDQAVKDGRIPPARREHWVAQLEADPGAEDTLTSLQPVIALDPVGYTGGVDESTDDDVYAKAGWATAEDQTQKGA